MGVAKKAVFKGFVCYLIGTLLAYLSPIPYANANPVGGNVSAGSASISTSGNTETITQKSQNAVIDWSAFNIGGKETTRFVDPNSSSLTVNRVHDMNPSKILGTLSANGNIVLINPNGVFFGQGSKVDVNGIIATTSDVKNSEVMAGGKMHFTPGGNPNASVENEGTITAKDAGLVGLVAPNVQNSGVITAKLGKVQLASGDSFTLDLYGDKLLEIGVSDSVKQQLVQNTGTIEADGGTVKLTAAAGRSIVNSLIDVDGEIHAPTFQEHNGTISIYAEGSNAVRNNVAANKGKKQGSSTVTVSGLLDAPGYNPSEKGGNINVLGDNVGIMQRAILDSSGDQGGGNIKIGGDFHGAGKTPTALSTVVEHGALIDADALTSGNGGNVAVWSDQFTTFAGRIRARGGAQSGNGGFVETSGHNFLSLTDSKGNNGMVDASAAKGLAGTWLLDPADVTISTVDSGGGTAPNYVPTGGVAESTINVANINTALNAGTNVSVTTGGDAASGTGGGSITVASNIAKTSGPDATLTLSAATDIIVNSNISISSTTGKLNTVFDADRVGGGGAIVMNSGSSITSNGGNITLGGGSLTGGLPSGAAVGDATNVVGVNLNNATLSAAGGAISINGTGYATSTDANYGVEIQGGAKVQTTGTGTIAISGTGGGTGTSNSDYGVYVTGTNTVASVVNGNLTITGTSGTTSGTNDYGVDLNDGGFAGFAVQTTGTGAISITGTSNGTSTTGNTFYYGIIESGISSTAIGGGGITLNAVSNSTGGQQNYSANIFGITTMDGNISVTGTAASASGNSYGVEVQLPITATGNGGITLNGTGSGSGVQNHFATISTKNGDINITGHGTGAGIWDIGTIKTTGTGNIFLTGTGTSNGSGMWLRGDTISVTASNGGNITLNGTGGTSSSDYGVEIFNSATISSASTNGTINITGTGGSGAGGSNYGVYITNTNTIATTGSGALTITGIGGGGANSYGIDTITGTNTIGGSTDNSNIKLVADTLSLANETITTGSSDTVTFAPHTASTTIGVAAGAGTLQITSGAASILANTTAGSIIIGNSSDTGLTTIDALSTATPMSFITGSSGSNLVSGAVTGTGSASLTFTGPTTLDTSLTTANQAISLNNAVTLGANSAINAGSGTLTFGSTVNGGYNLTGTAGTFSFASALGGIAPLSAVSLTSTNSLTLPSISAASITAQTTGSSSDITLASGSKLTASGGGTAITLAAGRNILNNEGSDALSAAGGRWLVYSTNPANDTAGGLSNDFRRFSCTYSGSCPSFPGTGNGFLYSYTPALTVTPNGLSIKFGDAVPNLSGYAYSLAGYLGSDLANDSIIGSLTGSTNYSQGGSGGAYNINYSSGSLASALGYGFSYANNARGLMVAAAATPPRTLTPAAQTPVQAPVNNPTPVATPATPVVPPATPVTASSVALALPGTVQQETAETANVTYALMPKPLVPSASDVQIASYYALMQLGAIPVTPAPTHIVAPAQAGAPIAATGNGTVTETQAPDGTNAAPGPTTDNSVDDHKKKGD